MDRNTVCFKKMDREMKPDLAMFKDLAYRIGNPALPILYPQTGRCLMEQSGVNEYVFINSYLPAGSPLGRIMLKTNQYVWKFPPGWPTRKGKYTSVYTTISTNRIIGASTQILSIFREKFDLYLQLGIFEELSDEELLGLEYGLID